MEKFESYGSERWTPVLEKLIVGVTHQISNRVSTLAGVSDILSGDPTVPPILRALADEVPKLEESIRLLRLLAAPDEPEEATEAPRLADDAISLAKLHPDLHGITYEKHGAGDAPPIVVRPVLFTQSVLVALTSAAIGSDSGVVTIRFSTDGDDLVVAVNDHQLRARTLAAAR